MGCLQFCLDITIYVDCYALLGSETQPLTVTLTQRESLASHACRMHRPKCFWVL